jgi:hypothetical protein
MWFSVDQFLLASEFAYRLKINQILSLNRNCLVKFILHLSLRDDYSSVLICGEIRAKYFHWNVSYLETISPVSSSVNECFCVCCYCIKAFTGLCFSCVELVQAKNLFLILQHLLQWLHSAYVFSAKWLHMSYRNLQLLRKAVWEGTGDFVCCKM